MSIDALVAVLPPPEGVSPVTAARWDAVERQVGTALPPDYKAFIDRYGLGRIAEVLSVFTPFSDTPHANLLQQARGQLDARRELSLMLDEPLIPALYPAPGGLLPFGGTDNGDVLFWLTQGEPEQWCVVVGDARSLEHETYPSGVAAFLADYVAGRLSSGIMPPVQPGQATFRWIAE